MFNSIVDFNKLAFYTAEGHVLTVVLIRDETICVHWLKSSLVCLVLPPLGINKNKYFNENKYFINL